MRSFHPETVRSEKTLEMPITEHDLTESDDLRTGVPEHFTSGGNPRFADWHTFLLTGFPLGRQSQSRQRKRQPANRISQDRKRHSGW
jgi:hypothetical protein